MGRVEGKVAFITGAARGQGRAHAITLAREGADIIAVDLAGPLPGVPYDSPTPDDLAETVREVEAAERRIIAEVADVRDVETMRAVVDRGVDELGRLDTNVTGVWNTPMGSGDMQSALGQATATNPRLDAMGTPFVPQWAAEPDPRSRWPWQDESRARSRSSLA